MDLLWIPLFLVAACVSAVHSSLEVNADVSSIHITKPVHILEEHNLLVLTPAGLTQMLNETRFLMVLFREYPHPRRWMMKMTMAMMVMVMMMITYGDDDDNDVTGDGDCYGDDDEHGDDGACDDSYGDDNDNSDDGDDKGH
ncbi:hypothetical protein P7K49_023096 [Saguinus oedipus]|uniref:Uncharacterized protein n=1 Tax=Saguinus oedipus TaxID=9490 RepID=A0ABQ9ULJ9_SAGOE|nr:hypothetical protein P7K49_023096 [Saguinus oedipus]